MCWGSIYDEYEDDVVDSGVVDSESMPLADGVVEQADAALSGAVHQDEVGEDGADAFQRDLMISIGAIQPTPWDFARYVERDGYVQAADAMRVVLGAVEEGSYGDGDEDVVNAFHVDGRFVILTSTEEPVECSCGAVRPKWFTYAYGLDGEEVTRRGDCGFQSARPTFEEARWQINELASDEEKQDLSEPNYDLGYIAEKLGIVEEQESVPA